MALVELRTIRIIATPGFVSTPRVVAFGPWRQAEPTGRSVKQAPVQRERPRKGNISASRDQCPVVGLLKALAEEIGSTSDGVETDGEQPATPLRRRSSQAQKCRFS